jgi:hypothetical protein
MGCGAAVVAVMPDTWPLFSPHQFALYHSLHSLDNLIWAALLDFTVIGVLAALFFFYLKGGVALRSRSSHLHLPASEFTSATIGHRSLAYSLREVASCSNIDKQTSGSQLGMIKEPEGYSRSNSRRISPTK